MEIKRHTVVEEYAGKDGIRVVVAFYYPSTTVNVSAYDSEGKRIFGGVYTSRAGAMIGIGRRFGYVQFVRMYTRKGWES